MDSILKSIARLCNMGTEYDVYDPNLIIEINSVLSTLHQLGVGPPEGFAIYDETAKWSDFITTDRLAFVRTYVELKVKLVFDPPTQSSVLKAWQDEIKEYEWRIPVAVDELKAELEG